MITAIVLAAGGGRRFGRNKLLATLDGRPLILFTLDAIVSSSVDEVLVVVGQDAELLERAVSGYRCGIVRNLHWEEGLSSSIRAGLSAAHPNSKGALLCPGDMPLLRTRDLNSLLEQFRSVPDSLVAPWAAGRQANPVILPRRFWTEAAALTGDVGCKSILAAHPDALRYVATPALGVLQDVDTPEDLEHASRRRLFSRLSELVVLVRGAGEMASGVAHRLTRSGFRVCMTELAVPLAIRRKVSFSEVVHEGWCTVEEVTGRLVRTPEEARRAWTLGEVPVIVDPAAAVSRCLSPDVIVDGIMAKQNLGTTLRDAPLVIGLGPGFEAGVDAHLVVETQRGHGLGRVIVAGCAQPDTGIPGEIAGLGAQRVIKSPVSGEFSSTLEIGDRVCAGDLVGRVSDVALLARTDGVLRGLLRSGTPVPAGCKLADIDPRGESRFCTEVSDKARAIAGGVLEGILMYYNL